MAVKQQPVTPLSGTQVKNGLTILRVVRDYQHDGKWEERYAHRVGRICVQCALTESNLHNYCNPNVPGSKAFPHDAGYEGTDHASVGVFQQQVPMWGGLEQCQVVEHATRLFLARLLPVDLHDENVAMQIQRVQVSGYPDGRNYAANRNRALAFMRQHWHAVPVAPFKTGEK